MTEEQAMAQADLVQDTCREIGKLLAGKEGGVQGAILMQLTAVWLSGHRLPRERINQLFDMHCQKTRAFEAVLIMEQIAQGIR